MATIEQLDGEPSRNGGPPRLPEEPKRLPEERLAWILGSSRSGSTWLCRMLGELAGAAAIDDPHIGHHLGVWRPISLAWATAEQDPELRLLRDVKADKQSYFFNDRYADAWRPALRQLIEARFGAEVADQLGGRAPRLVVVKEPGSQAAGLLLSLFPRSRLIFLLRDGRDAVDSWIDAYRDGSWAIAEGAYPLHPGSRLELIRWLASVWRYRTAAVREAYESHPADRRVLVRYEDLLADTERELARVAAACGLADSPPLRRALAEAAARHDFERVPSERRGRRREVRAASPGAWRTNFNGEEQEALQRALGPELEWAVGSAPVAVDAAGARRWSVGRSRVE